MREQARVDGVAGNVGGCSNGSSKRRAASRRTLREVALELLDLALGEAALAVLRLADGERLARDEPLAARDWVCRACERGCEEARLLAAKRAAMS